STARRPSPNCPRVPGLFENAGRGASHPALTRAMAHGAHPMVVIAVRVKGFPSRSSSRRCCSVHVCFRDEPLHPLRRTIRYLYVRTQVITGNDLHGGLVVQFTGSEIFPHPAEHTRDSTLRLHLRKTLVSVFVGINRYLGLPFGGDQLVAASSQHHQGPQRDGGGSDPRVWHGSSADSGFYHEPAGLIQPFREQNCSARLRHDSLVSSRSGAGSAPQRITMRIGLISDTHIPE